MSSAQPLGEAESGQLTMRGQPQVVTPGRPDGRPATSVSGALRAIAAMVGAQLAFLLNDTCVKLSSATLPMGEVIFLRGLLATLLIGAFVVAFRLHRNFPVLADRYVWMRIIGELGATLFYIAALIRMPIANTTIIFQATPLAVTAGAAFFLGETVGWRRWLAIAVGFAGVLIVVRPGPSGFNIYALFVLASVLFVTARDLATRALPAAVPTTLLTFATAVCVTLMGAGLGAIEEWHVPGARTLLEVAAAAILLSTGYVAIIFAMRHGEMSVTASFRYTAIVFAICSGYFVWHDTPDGFTIVGSLVIVSSGLYTLYRERRLAPTGGPLIAAAAAIDPPTGT